MGPSFESCCLPAAAPCPPDGGSGLRLSPPRLLALAHRCLRSPPSHCRAAAGDAGGVDGQRHCCRRPAHHHARGAPLLPTRLLRLGQHERAAALQRAPRTVGRQQLVHLFSCWLCCVATVVHRIRVDALLLRPALASTPCAAKGCGRPLLAAPGLGSPTSDALCKPRAQGFLGPLAWPLLLPPPLGCYLFLGIRAGPKAQRCRPCRARCGPATHAGRELPWLPRGHPGRRNLRALPCAGEAGCGAWRGTAQRLCGGRLLAGRACCFQGAAVARRRQEGRRQVAGPLVLGRTSAAAPLPPVALPTNDPPGSPAAAAPVCVLSPRLQSLRFGTKIYSETVAKVDLSSRPFHVYTGERGVP